jgi:protein-S-isoprenylcysteine O-methyltransferase Ste14
VSRKGDAALLVKNVLFTVLAPGTVAVVVPSGILASSGALHLRGVPSLRYLGLVPVLLGGAVYVSSVWGFTLVGRGTPAPIDPPRKLVVSGPYRFTRNPMYIGVVSVILGESLLFASVWLLAYALLVLAAFRSFVLLYEESALRRQFGPSYDAYCARVPRWLWRKASRDSEGSVG